LPVKHHFTDGVYVREVFYQRDSCYVKIHKTEHQFFILKGECIVWIDGVENFKSLTLVLLRQEQRVVYASKI
jgi:hypothetical protein